MAGFSSEWWPTSNRNAGRDQIGIPGRIASEFAVLLVGRELPAGLIGPQSVVVEVGSDRIDVTPPQSELWAREFSFERIILPSGPELALVVGAAVPAEPAFQRGRSTAPIVIEPPPLPSIVSKAAHLISRGRTDPDIETSYRAAGYVILRNPENGLRDLPEHGRREIVLVGIGDQRSSDIESAANQLRQTAMARGVNDRVAIRVSSESELSA